jgi:hypothetical protein
MISATGLTFNCERDIAVVCIRQKPKCIAAKRSDPLSAFTHDSPAATACDSYTTSLFHPPRQIR